MCQVENLFTISPLQEMFKVPADQQKSRLEVCVPKIDMLLLLVQLMLCCMLCK